MILETHSNGLTFPAGFLTFLLQISDHTLHIIGTVISLVSDFGKELDSFRDEMLNDRHLRIIHDFPETSDCFPGINIRGGVCHFLWDRNQKGDCLIYNHKGNIVTSFIERLLLEGNSTTFIRYNEAISILNKVRSFKEETIDNRVQSRLPFGIPSNFEN